MSCAHSNKARTFGLFRVVTLALATCAVVAVTPAPVRAATAPADDPLAALARSAADHALTQGIALVARGDWDAARRAFEHAVSWNHDLALGHFNLGVTLGVLKRPDEAIAAYRRTLQVAPAMSEALINLGVELFKAGRPHEALAPLEQAVRRAPEQAAGHHNLGVVLAELGRVAEAIRALEKADTLAPGAVPTRRALADTHYNLGTRRAHERHWRDALNHYQAAIRYDGAHAGAFNGAGIALARLGQDEAAVTMFNDALTRRPGFAEASYNLALALAALGRHAEAVDACRAALASRPTLVPAAQLLDSLLRAVAPGSRRRSG